MHYAEFKASLASNEPPAGLSLAMQALWWDAKGDWGKAHACAQAQDDADGAWVHAYLHRKEGDAFNAGYWYRQAGKPPFTGSLEAEWESLVQALLR
ncbi:MAG: hypothetical protein ACK4JD_02010 [Thermoflexales bacterium]